MRSNTSVIKNVCQTAGESMKNDYGIRVFINKHTGQFTIKINENKFKRAFENEINFIAFCDEFYDVTGIPLLIDSKIGFVKEYIENINAGGK